MSYIYDLWDDFISLIFPRLCYACGENLMRNEELICTGCYAFIPRTSFHTELNNPVARLFWGRCLVEKAAAFSYYSKGSRIRKLIHNLKYKGIEEIGYLLGRMYGPSLESSGFTSDIDLIIPVPLHPSRLHARGFNQSDIISKGIADSTGLSISTSSLTRIMTSSTQTRRSRYERWTNVEGIFSVNDPESLKGKHILLVDDVITTGSTIESCANELLKVEGVRISVVSIAFSVM